MSARLLTPADLANQLLGGVDDEALVCSAIADDREHMAAWLEALAAAEPVPATPEQVEAVAAWGITGRAVLAREDAARREAYRGIAARLRHGAEPDRQAVDEHAHRLADGSGPARAAALDIVLSLAGSRMVKP